MRASDTGPFALIPEWVLDATLSDRAVRLYAVLGRYADDEGSCWPSRRTLWTRLRCSERSLDAAVLELENLGAVTRHRQHRTDGRPGYTTNQWTVIRTDPAPPGAISAPTPGAGSAAKNESHRELEPSNDRANLVLLEPETSRTTEPYEEEFAKVWKVYPKKLVRKRALRAYQAQRRKGTPAEVLAAATAAYAAARAGQAAEYTMHGSTFFGPDDRWRDFDPASRSADALVEQLDAPDLAAMAKRAEAGPRTGTTYKHVAPWESE